MHNNLLLAQPSDEKLYVEDVFSTWLYTGNGSTQTITNGIDLSGKGGMVWLKSRAVSRAHHLFDTTRGVGNELYTNSTGAQANYSHLTSFNSDGFALSSGIYVNNSAEPFASWTFRKAPKFFDCVTWTGTGSPRTVAHSLGVAPGMIIVKCVSTASNWNVYHRSPGATQTGLLNNTNAFAASSAYWNDTTPTATAFTVTGPNNTAGDTFVAYLFAHDTTADGVIQCGTFTSGTRVNLGWEPQFILSKLSTGAEAWLLNDNMRGLVASSQLTYLQPNSSAAEVSGSGASYTPDATGFTPTGFSAGTHIYLAIRRGPMRTPTDATKVFKPTTWGGGTSGYKVTGVGFSPDIAMIGWQTLVGAPYAQLVYDKLRGASAYVATAATNAEATDYQLTSFDQDGFTYRSGDWTAAGYNRVHWMLRRAPGFFDVVCYNGVSNTLTLNHNLGVPPELIITKARTGTSQPAWYVAGTPLTGGFAGGNILNLNTTAAEAYQGYFSNPTSTTIFLQNVVARSGQTYVSYLFASCPGVSKVGSYTGNGSSLNIDCGFTNGARFVLIKRTNSTGDWYVWDTARGIVTANDPHLSLNTSAAEVTTNDTIDPLSSGFTVNQVASTNVNVNAATYIYLAIA